MPTLADIIVKKNDGTTNITYLGVAPASGDASPAVWRATTVGSAMSHQPELRLSSRDGSNGAKRVFRGTYRYPQIATNTTTGVTSVVDAASFGIDVTMPKGMSATDVNEFVAQGMNLLASALVQACLKSGYSAS